MSSLYTTGEDIDAVHAVTQWLLMDGFDVEFASDYEGYSIAIDLIDLYDSRVVAYRLTKLLGRRVATTDELDAEMGPA